MPIEFLKILDDDSYLALHKQITEDPASLLTSTDKVEPFKTLAKSFDLVLSDSTYRFDSSLKLALPKGKGWDVNGDRHNCEVIFNALPDLTPIEATDGRLWASLSFNEFSDYSNSRWAINVSPTAKNRERSLTNALREHWFATGARGRWRDNSISRLWWMAHYSNGFDDISMGTVLDIICLDSDLVGSLLGRPWTANNRLIVKYLLMELRARYFHRDSPKYSRTPFRKTLIELDLRAGKHLLAALGENGIEKLVHEVFLANHKDL